MMETTTDQLAKQFEDAIKINDNKAFDQVINEIGKLSDGNHKNELHKLSEKLHKDGLLPGLEITGVDSQEHPNLFKNGPSATYRYLVTEDGQHKKLEIGVAGDKVYERIPGAESKFQFKTGDGHYPVKVTYDGWDSRDDKTTSFPIKAEYEWPNGQKLSMNKTGEGDNYKLTWPDGSTNEARNVCFNPQTSSLTYENKYHGKSVLRNGSLIECDNGSSTNVEPRPRHIRDASGQDTFIDYDQEGKIKVVNTTAEGGSNMKLVRVGDDYEVYINGQLQKKDFRPFGLTGLSGGVGGGAATFNAQVSAGASWDPGDYKKTVSRVAADPDGTVSWFDPEQNKVVRSGANGSVSLLDADYHPLVTYSLQERLDWQRRAKAH